MSSARFVRPALAFPTFASATVTFAPSAWPKFEAAPFSATRYAPVGRLASGAPVRQGAGVTVRRFSLSYDGLTPEELARFVAPDGTGFFAAAGASPFVYRHFDGSEHTVRFASATVTATPTGDGRYDLAPFDLVVE
jgi:hypothetical protein